MKNEIIWQQHNKIQKLLLGQLGYNILITVNRRYRHRRLPDCNCELFMVSDYNLWSWITSEREAKLIYFNHFYYCRQEFSSETARPL